MAGVFLPQESTGGWNSGRIRARWPRVAIMHEWLTCYAGSERVVEQLLTIFPHADLFAVADFLPDSERAFLRGKVPRTTFIQQAPGARRWLRHYLPLMPAAVENLDLGGYDLVVSSSHAVAKGVLTGPDQLHVCYCHSPIRYAWDLQHQYLRQTGLTKGLGGLAARALLHYMRLWDSRTANGVDFFFANSSYIAGRIRKVYRREAQVLHPPVDTEYFRVGGGKEDFYLTAGRMTPYKRVDLIVEAFAGTPRRRLVVAGDGPEISRCRAVSGPNVSFAGLVPRSELLRLMQRTRAFVYAAEEDFGIVMAEAQACGTPVICYSRGGARDIVSPGMTGLLFDSQSASEIARAVDDFERSDYDPRVIRRNAERFSPERFRAQFVERLAEWDGRG